MIGKDCGEGRGDLIGPGSTMKYLTSVRAELLSSRLAAETVAATAVAEVAAELWPAIF